MNNEHLTEGQIQQYAIDKIEIPLKAIRHINSCETCSRKAEAYRLIFAEVKNATRPVFDFNLSDLIIPQLEPAKPKFPWATILIYIFIFIGLALTGLAFYSIRNAISGISSMGLYLMSAISLFILIIQVFEVYRKYQRFEKVSEF